LSAIEPANPGLAYTGLTVALIALILLSSFFGAVETAYTSVSRIRLKNMENNGSKRAKKVLKQLENFDRVLNTALIGNNLVNITAATLAGILFAMFILNEAASAIVATAVVTLAVLIFGDIIPKSMAKENPEKFTLFAQPAVGALTILFWPLTALFSLWRKIYKPKTAAAAVKGDELITIVEEAEEEGEIDSHESQLIRSAIEFDDVELYDIMTPRVNMVAVEDTDSIDHIAGAFAETDFSRLPVYHETTDVIVGILHEKDFYAALREDKKDILKVMKDGICLSRNMKISAALRTLQKAKKHMAIVVDEFGGTSGLVTLEDILEELVGEIYDEHDDEEEVLLKKLDEHTFVVSGSSSLEDMFEEMDLDIREEFESATVGGWVTEELQRIPLVGESFSYQNLDIVVTKASPRKVVEVKVVIKEVEEEAEEE